MKITEIVNIHSSDLLSHLDTIPSTYNFGSFDNGGTLFKEHNKTENKKV